MNYINITARIVILIMFLFGLNTLYSIDDTKPDEKIIKNENSEVIFDKKMKSLYNSLNAKSYNLNFVAFKYAMTGYFSMLQKGKVKNKKYVSIIDFTRPSDKKRFYTIDLEKNIILYHTYVAHGSNTGLKKSLKFSDKHQSHQSSLGFYLTGKTYIGGKGFSLRLHGDENGYNKNLYDRAVVIHTATYVSEQFAKNNGRLGRSWGCPVLPKSIYKKVINSIKGGSVIFAYYNDQTYLNSSKYLKFKELNSVIDTYMS